MSLDKEVIVDTAHLDTAQFDYSLGCMDLGPLKRTCNLPNLSIHFVVEDGRKSKICLNFLIRNSVNFVGGH